VIEDLKWADVASILLLVHVGEIIHDSPLLVVATSRTGEQRLVSGETCRGPGDRPRSNRGPLHDALVERVTETRGNTLRFDNAVEVGEQLLNPPALARADSADLHHKRGA
jgi:hypothetical protein